VIPATPAVPSNVCARLAHLAHAGDEAHRASRCFGGKLSASGVSFSAEILGRRRFANQKDSEALAVFCCFPLIFVKKTAVRDNDTIDADRIIPRSDEKGEIITVSDHLFLSI
jgi:hypothetical protein